MGGFTDGMAWKSEISTIGVGLVQGCDCLEGRSFHQRLNLRTPCLPRFALIVCLSLHTIHLIDQVTIHTGSSS